MAGCASQLVCSLALRACGGVHFRSQPSRGLHPEWASRGWPQTPAGWAFLVKPEQAFQSLSWNSPQAHQRRTLRPSMERIV
jgi:hypothetical protein